MTAPPRLALALKEWDVVVAALESGRQALLVRRGGLGDPGQRFSAPRSGPFWLFPNLFHERGVFLKPEYRDLLVPGMHRAPRPVAVAAGRPEGHARPATPGTVSLGAVAEVVDLVEAESLERLRALEERTVWTENYLTLRFRQRQLSATASVRPVVAVLRVSALPERVEVADLPGYAGCRSWVELRDPPDARAATPVWDERRLEEEVLAVRRLLGAPPR
ncbi:MAG TPA: DUF1802 family protein [Candidatus Dormibacteraeota bacterium]|nr:DUF1802 family protein [Candidatus Dormibacteraeota bacterium]